MKFKPWCRRPRKTERGGGSRRRLPSYGRLLDRLMVDPLLRQLCSPWSSTQWPTICVAQQWFSLQTDSSLTFPSETPLPRSVQPTITSGCDLCQSLGRAVHQAAKRLLDQTLPQQDGSESPFFWIEAERSTTHIAPTLLRLSRYGECD